VAGEGHRANRQKGRGGEKCEPNTEEMGKKGDGVNGGVGWER